MSAPIKADLDRLNHETWLAHPSTKSFLANLLMTRDKVYIRASQKAEIPNLSDLTCRIDLIKAKVFMDLVEAVQSNNYEKL